MSSSRESFWLPDSMSTLAPEIDFGWNLVLGIATVLFVLVVGAMLFFAWRYRRRHPDEIPNAPTHNTRLEVVWTLIPVGVVIVLFAVGFKGFLNVSVAPAEAMEIGVAAERWMWTFTYPDGTTSVNELRVPRGRPVKLLMSSKDVIHAFWVPELRIKRDIIPGKYTTLWFEATKTGEVKVLCTEYCGAGHSNMLATLVVMEEREFEEWLESGGGDKDLPPVEQGKKLFVKMACNTCHSTDGVAKTGPTIKGLYDHEVKLASGEVVKADENYLRESIVNPAAKIVQGYQPVMPMFRGLLTQQQIDALIAYIKSVQ